MFKHFKLIPLCAALAIAGISHTATAQTKAAPVTSDQLLQRMEAMAAELQSLRGELSQLKAAQTQTAATAQHANDTAVQAKTAVADVSGPGLRAEPATMFSGYGEINYNRPTRKTSDSQIDVRRIVLGVQHRFSENTKFVGEFEFEHAVTSATDRGEVAVEQAYIEHQIRPNLAAKAGLFLIPVGLLNENHEPTAFYGVERNFIETAIIPSTWREAGVQLVGSTEGGFTWNAGVSTGFDLTKWDSQSGDGKESPLGSIHQEGQLAKAKDLAVFGAVNWRGVPGLQVGGSVFSGGAGHGQLAGAKPRITVYDIHARWTPGKWDMSAVYARATISNTGRLNVLYAGDSTPIPANFDGGYVQAAYNIWSQGDYKLTPFARIERFNTAKTYAGFPAGLSRSADGYERVATLGANFQIAPGVVVKTDYQRFSVNKDANRFNVGLGYAF